MSKNDGKFIFRHRTGNVNWRLISYVDIDDIVEDGNVLELQTILDAITFCDFKKIDVRNNSIESVTKLVNLYQLTCEYLLYSQENQYKIVQTLHHRNSKLKLALQDFNKENKSLKEDSKIYQRQLAILRQSLSKAQDMIREVNIQGYGALMSDQKEVKALNTDFIQELLDQHRNTYMKDVQQLIGNSMGEIIRTVQTNIPNNESKSTDVLLEFSHNIEEIIKSIITTSMNLNRNSSIPAYTTQIESKEKSPEIINLESNLKLKTETIEKLQNEMKIKEINLQQKENNFELKLNQFEFLKTKWEEEKLQYQKRLQESILKSQTQIQTNEIQLKQPTTMKSVEVMTSKTTPLKIEPIETISVATSTVFTSKNDNNKLQLQQHHLGFQLITKIIEKSKLYYVLYSFNLN